DRKYLLFAANPQIAVKRFPLAQAVAEELKRRDGSTELLVVYKEPQDRLALFMNACDALVFTSYQEGSPNIVKQAMACNLPIVSADVGDVREVIADAKGCYVCDADVDAFVKPLESILAGRERTDGRAKVEHLARPFVAREIIRVYEQVLGKRSSQVQERNQILMLLENLPFPQDVRVRREAFALSSAGYQVAVICPSAKGQPSRETINGVCVYRYPAPTAGNGFFAYLGEYAYSMAASAALSLVAFFREGFDAIHAHNPPDTFVFIALFYKLFGK